MQRNLDDKTILLPRAFAPASVRREITEDDYKKLYGGDKPIYAEELEKFRYTADIDKITLKHNIQLETLLNHYIPHVKALGNRYAGKKLYDFFYTLTRRYYRKQPAAFYASTKQSLEIIFLELQKNRVESSIVKPAMEELTKAMSACVPGSALNHYLAKLICMMVSDESLSVWLAQFRALLTQEYVDKFYMQYHNGDPDDKVHGENVFMLDMLKRGLNPYGAELLKNAFENYAPLVKAKKQHLDECHNYVLEKYTSKAMMSHLARTLRDRILVRYKNKPQAMRYDEFFDSLSDLPIIHEKNGIHVGFNMMDETEKGEPLVFGDHAVRLRSADDIMIRMTKFLNDNRKSYFQIHEIEYIHDNLTIGLVPENPEVSFVFRKKDNWVASVKTAAEMGIFPKNKKDFLLLDQFHCRVPISKKHFNYFIHEKQRKEFIGEVFLENIDISNLSHQYNFGGAEFENVTLTPLQYGELQINGATLHAYHIKHTYISARYVKTLNTDEKNQLLFYAAVHHASLVTPLLKEGADRLKVNAKGYEAIKCASLNGRWRSVDKFLEFPGTTPAYGSLLIDALIGNNTKIVKRLLELKQIKKCQAANKKYVQAIKPMMDKLNDILIEEKFLDTTKHTNRTIAILEVTGLSSVSIHPGNVEKCIEEFRNKFNKFNKLDDLCQQVFRIDENEIPDHERNLRIKAFKAKANEAYKILPFAKRIESMQSLIEVSERYLSLPHVFFVACDILQLIESKLRNQRSIFQGVSIPDLTNHVKQLVEEYLVDARPDQAAYSILYCKFSKLVSTTLETLKKRQESKAKFANTTSALLFFSMLYKLCNSDLAAKLTITLCLALLLKQDKIMTGRYSLFTPDKTVAILQLEALHDMLEHRAQHSPFAFSLRY